MLKKLHLLTTAIMMGKVVLLLQVEKWPIRGLTSLEVDSLLVFYYLSSSEFRPGAVVVVIVW